MTKEETIAQVAQRLGMLSAMGLLAPSRRKEVEARLGDIMARRQAREITTETAVYECKRDGVLNEAAMMGRLEAVLRSGQLDILSWVKREELQAQRMPETVCPHCGKPVNCQLGPGRYDATDPGVAVCAECGGASEISADGSVRAYTEADWSKLSTAERALIESVCGSVRESKAQA